ncbi:MAG: V-type ATPase subunit [Candidatus Izemoplasmatales bacterium]|jgi:V/A-type H+-transporting ATPase subunit C|nr:V-type ATPase subunit [Candidatus Izemoplasmatales bacterium]
MSSWTSNAIITKAKAIYGNRLKEEDYKELVKKKSVSDIVRYLKSNENYKELLEDIQDSTVHRGQLEEMIKKTIFNSTLKLVKFIEMKDKEFYELNLNQREIDLILATIRAIISDSSKEVISEFPTFFIRHAHFDIYNLTKSKTYQEMLDSLVGTIYYDKLIPFYEKDAKNIKYPEIEQTLDHCYYECVFRIISENYKGKLKRDLENIFITKIELTNIIKIYRLKKFYQSDVDAIKKTLITKYSRISEKKINEIAELKDADMVLSFLEKSEYSKFLDEDDYVFIEYYAEKIKYNLAKRYMYFSSDAPTVYSSFLILNEIERENLFNIIEGIRYNLDESEIEKMLIY